MGRRVTGASPAHRSIVLQTPSGEPAISATVTDLLGREVSHETLSTGGEMDVSSLPRGLYLVTAVAPSGKVYAGKFTKG